MIDLSTTTLIPLVAFIASFLATRRSLGLGLTVVLAVGYFHGIIRANIVSVFTSFLFDSAVLGMYIGIFFQPKQDAVRAGASAILKWIIALTLWPLIISAIPQNDILIQFVAFRATAWFLPMIWVGSRLTDQDLRIVARSLAGLNAVTLAFGVYEYVYGVQALYPVNEITHIIYKSGDVAGTYLRIPATFLNAHSYGGTMASSLPFLLGRFLDRRSSQLERSWLIMGVVVACGGILLCAARQPVVVTIMLLFTAWVMTGFSPRVGLGIFVSVVILGFVVGSNERLQRFTSLTETQGVVTRLRGSVNENFIDYLLDYPFGAGMGSSVGTSIPYFLLDRSPQPIGLENEYCRILIDQGWIGLLMWLAFLYWVHWPPPKRRGPNAADPMVILMYAMTLTTWATAVIGTGLLSAIPTTAMLLAQIGLIVAQRFSPSPARPGVASDDKTLPKADVHYVSLQE